MWGTRWIMRKAFSKVHVQYILHGKLQKMTDVVSHKLAQHPSGQNEWIITSLHNTHHAILLLIVIPYAGHSSYGLPVHKICFSTPMQLGITQNKWRELCPEVAVGISQDLFRRPNAELYSTMCMNWDDTNNTLQIIYKIITAYHVKKSLLSVNTYFQWHWPRPQNLWNITIVNSLKHTVHIQKVVVSCQEKCKVLLITHILKKRSLFTLSTRYYCTLLQGLITDITYWHCRKKNIYVY